MHGICTRKKMIGRPESDACVRFLAVNSNTAVNDHYGLCPAEEEIRKVQWIYGLCPVINP